MLLNYLKTSIRYLTKHAAFAVIGIVGLTTGIAAFLLIALYIQNERSFDKHIPNPKCTYRLVGIQEPRGLDHQHVAFTSGAWSGFIHNNLSGVEDAFRIMHGQNTSVETADDHFRVHRIYFAEGRVLQHLGYPVLHAIAPEPLLNENNHAFISRELALRMFGKENATGHTFRNENKSYLVAAVFENKDIKSHWNPDIVLSLSSVEEEQPWLSNFQSNSVATYVVMETPGSTESLEETLNAHYAAIVEETASAMPITFYLQRVDNIYQKSGHLKFHIRTHEGSIQTTRIFVFVGFLILIIACINFVNLASANAFRRTKEVGMRKVLGANRSKLIIQFMGEATLLSALSMIMALMLTELLLPHLNALLGTNLYMDFANNPLLNIGLIILLTIIAVLSGLYPAIFLSGFRAIEVFKTRSASGKPRGGSLRKALVVFQFSMATTMLFVTLVMVHQTRFLNNKDRGYSPENVVSIPINQSDYESIFLFSESLKNQPGIVASGIASNYNGVAGNQSDIVVADSLQTRQMVRYGFVNPDFFPTMGMAFVEGRNFLHEAGSDRYGAIIINESTVKALGWENPVGKRFRAHESYDTEYHTVVGVVKDYNYYSLHSPVEPAVYLYVPENMHTVVVRFNHANPDFILNEIRRSFDAFFPNQYFDARMVEDILDRQILNERNLFRLFTWFSALCIIISCLGLLGLTSFMVNQKRKEVSIRKVLGATVSGINTLLLSVFLKWVLLAAAIAIPLGYLGVGRWLENYPYRIGVGVVHILLPLAVILIIATATVLSISTTAARQNPADNLKYE